MKTNTYMPKTAEQMEAELEAAIAEEIREDAASLEASDIAMEIAIEISEQLASMKLDQRTLYHFYRELSAYAATQAEALKR